MYRFSIPPRHESAGSGTDSVERTPTTFESYFHQPWNVVKLAIRRDAVQISIHPYLYLYGTLWLSLIISIEST